MYMNIVLRKRGRKREKHNENGNDFINLPDVFKLYNFFISRRELIEP